jgi:hypothetical protein
MAYIGKQPVVGNFQKCDAISVVNGQAAYTLNVGGAAVSPENANHMLVSLNGVLQAPGDSFTVSGSTLTFASNLATGDVIDFVIILGDVLDLGTPSDNSISTAKLVANSVTAAKFNADVISGQTALASEPADTDEFLVSDAGVLKRIDYSLIKGGGSRTLLLTSNFSDVASVTVNATYITSTYRDYYYEISQAHPATDNVGLRMTFSEDNASSFLSSNYSHMAHGINQGASEGSNTDASAQYLRLHNANYNGVGNQNNECISSFGYLFNPLSTAFNTMIIGQSAVIDNSNTMYITTYGGKNSSTSATNAIKFAFSSGNLSTGQLRFYGIT